MYEDTYGTDWDTLSEAEAIERAYALGVETAMGDRRREEYERVLAAVDGTYQERLVELAYDEGRSEAKSWRSEAGSDDPEAAWTSLVEEIEPPDGEAIERAAPAFLSRLELLEGPADDELQRLRLPEFLFRE